MSSNNSSAAASSSGLAPPARRRFALTGPSTLIDPLTQPVRRDLADIELAEHVFAPHYALAIMTECTLASVTVHASEAGDATAIDVLGVGDLFRVLEVGREFAWGQAVASGVVGYVDRSALEARGAA